MEIFVQGYQRCTVLDLTQYYPNVKLTEKKPCICTHFHSSLNFGVWLPGYFDLFSKRKIKLKFDSVRMANSTCRDVNCIMEQIRHRESLKGIEKKLDQPDNRCVVDLVMHSNKQTGPLWRIHPKTFRTFQLTRNFAIWQIVTQASLNLDRFYSTCILATIQYSNFGNLP